MRQEALGSAREKEHQLWERYGRSDCDNDAVEVSTLPGFVARSGAFEGQRGFRGKCESPEPGPVVPRTGVCGP